MAIGSAPEIGTKFTTWGKMDEATQRAWFEHIRTSWGPNLVNGYGTLMPTPDIQSFNQKEGR